SQHPSLRSKEKSKQHKSVLKRHERLKELITKEKWKEGDSIFGLPKIKIVKFKIRKEKAVPAAAAVEGAAAEAQAQVSEETKAGAKEAVGKKEAAPKKEAPKK
ncbi:MAG: hypothetical protein A2Z72_05135, partial [Omnitrophica bacterium RBG_13_46_9]